MQPIQSATEERGLLRAVGLSGLTANIVNTTIGAGIFVLPASVAASLGGSAPIAFVICAVAMALFVTCFAIAGSRVSLTGGIYAYVEVAFGRYVAFLTGVLLYLSTVLSVAGVVTLFAGSVGTLVPLLNGVGARAGVALLVYAALAAINVRGVRLGSGAVTTITIAKLLPILLFVGVGLFFCHGNAFSMPPWPGNKALGETVLLLMFAFVGIEVALVPSGEVKNPSRTVPRAIYLALLITTALYVGIQVVAQGVLGPELPNYSAAPLAEAASHFLGNFGRTVLLAGATISAFGFVASDVLSSPRILFALGRDRILPAWFARVHPRYRSPDVAIVAHAGLAFCFSITSTFETLAVMANVAVLFAYVLGCLAAWQLTRRDVRSDGPPFVFPGARLLPFVAIAVIVWMLCQASAREFRITAIVLGVATALYLLREFLSRRTTR